MFWIYGGQKEGKKCSYTLSIETHFFLGLRPLSIYTMIHWMRKILDSFFSSIYNISLTRKLNDCRTCNSIPMISLNETEYLLNPEIGILYNTAAIMWHCWQKLFHMSWPLYQKVRLLKMDIFCCSFCKGKLRRKTRRKWELLVYAEKNFKGYPEGQVGIFGTYTYKSAMRSKELLLLQSNKNSPTASSLQAIEVTHSRVCIPRGCLLFTLFSIDSISWYGEMTA